MLALSQTVHKEPRGQMRQKHIFFQPNSLNLGCSHQLWLSLICFMMRVHTVQGSSETEVGTIRAGCDETHPQSDAEEGRWWMRWGGSWKPRRRQIQNKATGRGFFFLSLRVEGGRVSRCVWQPRQEVEGVLREEVYPFPRPSRGSCVSLGRRETNKKPQTNNNKTLSFASNFPEMEQHKDSQI